jgi:tRNA(adenine34) deaminase
VTASEDVGQPFDDAAAMGLALALADEAAAAGEVPVGAVVLRDGRVVGSGRNRREASGDPTAHAELLALRDAATAVGTWRLDGCTLVVTLEPCPMCAGAVWAARISRVVFGAADPSAGASGSLYNVAVDTRLNHQSEVSHGVRADECRARLDSFFAGRRGV